MGSLHPEFIKTKYKKQAAYMSRLDKLNKIESNFKIDQYSNEKIAQPQLMHNLSKTASKADIKISKNFKIDILD